MLQICADVCTHFLHPQALLHSLSCWQARSTLSWWAAPPAAPVASWAHADAGGWMGVGGWVGGSGPAFSCCQYAALVPEALVRLSSGISPALCVTLQHPCCRTCLH